MSTIDTQTVMDFFFDFDNYALPSWRAGWLAFKPDPPTLPPTQSTPPTQAQLDTSDKLQRNWGEVGAFTPYQQLVSCYPDMAMFTQRMERFKTELDVVQSTTCQLLEDYFGDSLDKVRDAFVLFAQGTMYDPRRKSEVYTFWTIHSMDSTYPDQPPVGYYSWYPFIRAYSLVSADETKPVLNMCRSITLAAAIQEQSKPRGVSGPTPNNPHNPPIGEVELGRLCDIYMCMSFAELDELYATAMADSPIGPPPVLGRRG